MGLTKGGYVTRMTAPCGNQEWRGGAGRLEFPLALLAAVAVGLLVQPPLELQEKKGGRWS